MRSFFGGTSLALALLLTGCGEGGNETAPAGDKAAPIAAIPAPAGQDWTETVSQTADGGFLMGNPNAPVKLVEYASLTCPHCAAFSAEGGEEIKNEFVKSGQVSFEFRNFVLNPIDLGATMLVHCQGPGPYFKLTEQLFATQQQWTAGFQTLSPADQQRIQSLPAEQQVGALAKAGGLDGFFRQRGMPQAKIDACLADQAGVQRIVQLNETATNRDKVTGTPTFMINGELVEGVSSWDALEPKLRAAIG